MIEHLSNCHGEWNMLIAVAGSIPFVGAWLRLKLESRRKKEGLDGSR